MDKTIDFSLAIVKYCEVLEKGKKYVIAKQLLRSATSIGAKNLKHKMQKVKLLSYIK
ncbi:MAG: four helix bundle protein [Chitinophagaceae bacterium]